MNIKNKTAKYFKNFLLAQLIVTLAMIPVLVNWGLELSVMSFFGNLIFTPFLMIFLMLSSLVFFTQLLCIPNNWLIFLLNQTTLFWDKILNLSSKDWLFGFSKAPTWPLFLIALFFIYFLKNKLINSHQKQICALTFGIILMLGYLQFYPYTNPNLTFNKKLLINIDGTQKINIVDNGLFNQTKNLEKMIEFELKPFLIQNFGKSKIENLIIKNPTHKNLDGAMHSCKILNIKKITLPFFKETLDKKTWRSFFLLRNFLKENNIEFLRIAESEN
ncbi:MAG: hypothetical protein ABIA74_01590 [bacterium]